jgi:DNA-binding MarR family transcriptional regulator
MRSTRSKPARATAAGAASARPTTRAVPTRGIGHLSEEDYAALAAWRYALRRFLSASEAITRAARVSPTQYQLLLFIKGFPDGLPSVADLAERLQIRHQSAVGLIDRSERARLVRRRRDPGNRRRVLVGMTARGAALLRRLAEDHFATIDSLGSAFLPPVAGAHARPRRKVPSAASDRTREPARSPTRRASKGRADP